MCCRDVVINGDPSITMLIKRLQGTVTDETVVKYLIRLKQKLKLVPIDLQKPKEKVGKVEKTEKLERQDRQDRQNGQNMTVCEQDSSIITNSNSNSNKKHK